ncbi:MAG: hypothetical protein JW862_18785 [Anaerolineales bacterium]|nr:hypothetical protein [Anaerolineales bacterium]
MKNRKSTWFLAGFGLTFATVLLVLVAIRVPGGLAAETGQGPDNPNWIANRTSQTGAASNPAPGLANRATSPSGTPLVVPAAEFGSNGFFPESVQFVFTTGTWQGTDSVGDGCLMAPAYLPNGVTVTGLQVTFVDDDATNSIVFDLYRINSGSGLVEKMATLDSSAFPASPDFVVHATTTISSPVISYPNYAYYLSTCLPSLETRLAGMQVYYTSTP